MSTIELDYLINDIVVCKIRDYAIVDSKEKQYDDKLSLKVIGFRKPTYSSPEFAVYVPDYDLTRLHTDIVVSKSIVNEFHINPRFIGEHMTYIKGTHVDSIEYKADGMECSHCKTWHDLAGPNQPDMTFRCRACTDNPWR